MRRRFIASLAATPALLTGTQATAQAQAQIPAPPQPQAQVSAPPQAQAQISAPPQAPTPRAIVLDFFDLVFTRKRVAEGFARHVGAVYIQHNPRVPDGAEPAIRFLSARFRDNPEASNSLKRVIAEGDLVVVHHHSRNTPQDRGLAIMDIFRVEAGKIVEHWDVIQPVPEAAANPNTMF